MDKFYKAVNTFPAALSLTQIADHLYLYLPASLQLTEEQQKFLNSILIFYEDVAIVWKAILCEEALPWEKKQKLGNKFYHDLLEQVTDQFQCLWNLIDYASPILVNPRFPIIKNNMIQYQIKDDNQESDLTTIFWTKETFLFYLIVVQKAYADFSKCLHPYYKASRLEKIKMLELACQILPHGSTRSIKPHKLKNIKIYKNIQEAKNPYLARLIAICYQMSSQGDQEMKKYLNKYLNAHRNILELRLKYSKRTRSTKNLIKDYSYEWHNGKIKYGNKTGGTYS